jgi:hypothetical protein
LGVLGANGSLNMLRILQNIEGDIEDYGARKCELMQP